MPKSTELDKDGYETYIAVTGEVWKIKPIAEFDIPPPAVNGPLVNFRAEPLKDEEDGNTDTTTG